MSKIAAVLTRRKALSFLGGTAAASLLGCLRGQSAPGGSKEAVAQGPASISSTCIVRPEQTEGPYFTDERINRADLRSDPSDGSISQGVPLRLVFHVSQLAGQSCLPLEGATVDVWHCDAQGVYSDVVDRSFNTVGKKFLRGYQTTDQTGTAEFVTIYPGWYPGRAVHIHFKIRTAAAAQPVREFTSQLYFDDAISDRVHTQVPYAKPGQRALNRQDGIFQRGGEQLILQLTEAAEGYAGRFDITLEQA